MSSLTSRGQGQSLIIALLKKGARKVEPGALQTTKSLARSIQVVVSLALLVVGGTFLTGTPTQANPGPVARINIANTATPTVSPVATLVDPGGHTDGVTSVAFSPDGKT